ncbi:MAG: hypothetical protein RIR70_1660 [Pseudomonadota bacterium]|jgi:hypothetical protein
MQAGRAHLPGQRASSFNRDPSGFPLSSSAQSLRSASSGRLPECLILEPGAEQHPGYVDLTAHLALLGLVDPGRRVSVPHGLVSDVIGAAGVLSEEGFVAGQPCRNERASQALLFLYTVRAITAQAYHQACRLRVAGGLAEGVAVPQVAPVPQPVAAPAAAAVVPAAAEPDANQRGWRQAGMDFYRNSRFCPQNRWSAFFLATIPVHIWGALEYTFYGGARMTVPGENKPLVGYQMGVMLPMGLIPMMVYIYLRLNKEAIALRRANLDNQPPRQAAPDNV